MEKNLKQNLFSRFDREEPNQKQMIKQQNVNAPASGDSSSAAIIASALLNLSTEVKGDKK